MQLVLVQPGLPSEIEIQRDQKMNYQQRRVIQSSKVIEKGARPSHFGEGRALYFRQMELRRSSQPQCLFNRHLWEGTTLESNQH